MEGPVGARQLARSVSVANNGIKYHCGTHAFNTTRSFKHYVKFVNPFLARRIHTATCAKDIRDETCHSWDSLFACSPFIYTSRFVK